jgi:4-amino-4-deoxy-L-arabinose transferase-like glycosyltransferase
VQYDLRDWISLVLLGAIASVLLLLQLDQPFLWQDEAQTAVVSRTILHEGVPRGTDGLNFFSQEWGAEYADDHLWRWHTWLSFYTVAGSFALLGETTAAARLPFALLGLATVLLAYVAGRRLWRSQDAGLATGALLGLSVPFLVLSRQCRWYPMAAFFALLGLHAYGRIGPGEKRHSVLLFVAATLLFHTHYFYTATLLATLLVHSLWLERERFPRVFVVSAAVTLVNAPWIVWFADIRYGEAYADYLSSLGITWQIGSHLTQDFFVYFLSPLFLAIPAGLLIRRRIRGESGLGVSVETNSGVVLLALFTAITIVALAVLAPGAFFRYLAPLAVPAMLLAGLMLASLAKLSRVAAIVFFALWLGLSPFRDFVYEITHDFDGPIEGIVRFLNKRAQPGDRVAITYGDMPLKFYTDLRVIGGLTGEDLTEAAGAEWIIIRRHQAKGIRGEVRKTLRDLVVPADYAQYKLPYPDTPFENREDPRSHLYRTAAPSMARVVIFGRTVAARARDAQAARQSAGP